MERKACMLLPVGFGYRTYGNVPLDCYLAKGNGGLPRKSVFALLVVWPGLLICGKVARMVCCIPRGNVVKIVAYV